MLDLSTCTSITGPGGLIEMLKNYVDSHSGVSNIVGVHWDQEKLGRFPTLHDLDSACSTTPVWLWRTCWHIGVGNSLLLSTCSASTWYGEGGVVERDSEGELTGVLKERATEIVAGVIGDVTEEEKWRMIEEGLDICRVNGLTTVASNELNQGAEAYRKIHAEGELKTRVFMTPMCDELEVDEPLISPFSTDDGMLSFNRVKIFGDGSLGAGTAAIEGDEGGGGGVLINTGEEIRGKIKRADELGWRLEIHAIGDLAAKQVLDALEDCGVGGDKRPVLTHCQVLSNELVERMRVMNVIANVQPSFVPTDMEWVEKRLTVEKQRYSYCWRTLIERGNRVAGGSDAPVESCSPLRGMYDAMFRRSRTTEGRVFREEERMTFEQALGIYTIGGAYACGREGEMGRIEEGFFGDCVLIEDDEVGGWEKLKDMKPEIVIVGGRVVYERGKEDGEDNGGGEGKVLEGPFIPGKGGGGFVCACIFRGKSCSKFEDVIT